MANNPYVNKVEYGDQTVMDISDTTAQESDVAEGEIFYKGSGERSVGTGNYYSPNDTTETDVADADYFPFYDASASAKKKTLWSNIKSKLKTYFDTLYQDKLTFDDWPVKNSRFNPVRSSGLYDSFLGTETLMRDTVGLVRKNLFQIPSSIVSTTISGVEFTIHRNTEGECIAVGAYGVATDDIIFELTHPTEDLDEEFYIISGCPEDGSISTYYISVWDDYGRISEIDTGNGCRVIGRANPPIGVHIAIRIREGTDMSTWDFQPIFFHPMRRKADIVSDTFYPYTNDIVKGDYYSPDDITETDIADGDYFPFYDTSASEKKKTLWSNIKAKLKTYFDTLYLAKVTLAAVATSGAYSDLSGRPTIPTVNNGTLTIQKNGTNVATFTANQSGSATANITVPTVYNALDSTSTSAALTANMGKKIRDFLLPKSVSTTAICASSNGTILSSGQMITSSGYDVPAGTYSGSSKVIKAGDYYYIKLASITLAQSQTLLNGYTIPDGSMPAIAFAAYQKGSGSMNRNTIYLLRSGSTVFVLATGNTRSTSSSITLDAAVEIMGGSRVYSAANLI